MRKNWIIIAVGVLAVLGIAVVALFTFRGEPQRTAAPATAVPPSPAPSAAPTGSPQQAAQSGPALTAEDRVLGTAAAPVTIIEYASLTCPHCAQFHEGTLPRLKSEYIDTGKIRLVFRDFPLDQVALRAATLAECAPPERYFGLLQILFQGQASWATSQDPQAALARLGKLGGLSDEQVTACLTDEKRMDAVVAERLAGEKEFAIRSTPTFVINGRKFTGALTFEQIQEIVRPMLP